MQNNYFTISHANHHKISDEPNIDTDAEFFERQSRFTNLYQENRLAILPMLVDDDNGKRRNTITAHLLIKTKEKESFAMPNCNQINKSIIKLRRVMFHLYSRGIACL